MRYLPIALSCGCLLSACSAIPARSQSEPSDPSSGDVIEREPARLLSSPRLAPPAPANAPLPGDSALSTPGRLQLGHYATKDGLFGLVIDRSGAVPLARVDKNPAVFELAVRRGSTVTELISLEGELVISIDSQGRHSIVQSAPEMWLMRDGDAEALPRPAAPVIDSVLLRRLEELVKSQCGSAVRFADVTVVPGSQLGLKHGLHRAARAVVGVCADELGKAAVKRRLKGVRLVHAKAGPTDMRFEAGELVVSARYDEESFGPFADELRRFLESHF